jgi:PAS domain S-box-containing protein
LAIFLISQDGKILRINQEAQKLLQYGVKELLNSKIFRYFPPEEKKSIFTHYEEKVYNLKTNKKETKIRRKDGKIIEVQITSTILKIKNSIIIQSFISDITSRKQNERNRELLLDQLNKSLEFKDKFLAEMSHDLRTPLNAIIGFSSLLLDESYGDLNKTQYDFLNDVYNAAEHLDDLIKSMLDLSKIEIGKLKLHKQKFSLFKLLKGLQSIFKPKYEKKGISFSIESINQNTYIYADQLRFKQILFNLIDNAIKFTEKGEVTFRGIERSDHWEFQVIDTGVGIKKEDYDLVFREFGRIENDITKKVSGSGIGLALTKRLIELHNGEIWFKSELNKGTSFFFIIPKKRTSDRINN